MEEKQWNCAYFNSLKEFLCQDSRMAHDDLCRLMEQYPYLRVPSFRPPLVGNGFQICATKSGNLSVSVSDYSETQKFITMALNFSEVSQANVILLTAAVILSIPIDCEEL